MERERERDSPLWCLRLRSIMVVWRTKALDSNEGVFNFSSIVFVSSNKHNKEILERQT